MSLLPLPHSAFKTLVTQPQKISFSVDFLGKNDRVLQIMQICEKKKIRVYCFKMAGISLIFLSRDCAIPQKFE